MNNAFFDVKFPQNEPVKGYMPGSSERAALKAELERQLVNQIDVPVIINGKEFHLENKATMVCPHDHQQILGRYSVAGEKELLMAIDAAEAARGQWENMPWEQRATIFLKAADLITGKYRSKLSASCMLGQSKNPYRWPVLHGAGCNHCFSFRSGYLHGSSDQSYRSRRMDFLG